MILEQRLHRRLSRWCTQNRLTAQQPVREQLFLFGIFTSTISPNLATHSFDHSFFRFTGRAFEGLTCTVINLGDTSQSEYKSQSHLVLPVYHDVVDCLLQQSNKVAGSANSAVSQIAAIHDSLETNLQILYNQVTKDEALVRKLKRDVELMRNQLRIRESAAASPATPGTPDPDSLWLNIHSPLSTTSSSGISRSSSTNTSSTHQPFSGPPQSLVVGKRQTSAAVVDTQGCKSNSVTRQTTGNAKNGTSFVSGVTSCISTSSTESIVGAGVQKSVFAMLPALSQGTPAPTKQGLVFGGGTSVADGQSSKATKHFVPQIANQTGYRTSEVPELSSQRNTNPFRVDTQFVNDDSRDIEGVRHPIGKR